VLLIGAALLSWWAHSHNPQDWVGLAVSAIAAYAMGLLLVIAVFDRRFAFLPGDPLPAWLPIRSSLIMICFFVGILVGHFVWS
jgi:hypothetical protein